jgi:DNA-binding transcriptional LysR family regulator
MDAQMLNLNDLHFFVQAVDAGGFAAAGRRLGCPKSTVSKRVAELEAALGVRLVHRTARRFVLTDVGQDFHVHARAAIIEAEAAQSAVHTRLAEPAGTVNITASVPTAQFRLADQLPLLAREYPKVQVRLHVTDRFVDLVQEGFDIAVRSHMAPLPDSGLVQRQLRTQPIVLVASPDYLALRGVPAAPADLASHDGLVAGPSSRVWQLRNADVGEVAIAPIPRLLVDEPTALLRCAEASLGIAPLPRTFAASALEAGRLCPVLPGWNVGTVTTTLLVPHRRGQLPAVRAVIDFLVRHAGA